jgi:hypothetical protein
MAGLKPAEVIIGNHDRLIMAAVVDDHWAIQRFA